MTKHLPNFETWLYIARDNFLLCIRGESGMKFLRVVRGELY
jgi:hypothetical protein